MVDNRRELPVNPLKEELEMMKKMMMAICSLVLLTACAEPLSKTQKGGLYGTAGGAAAGALIGQAAGRDTKATLLGAGIGAAVGGASGAGIGYYMDKQEARMREALKSVAGVKVDRDGNNLNISFRSDNQFKVGSAVLQGEAQNDLHRFADVIKEFDKTNVTVIGHTDSVGTESANQKLSEDRAAAVRNLLVARGVAAGRVTTLGLGEGKPVADNATEYGRQLNRRIEILVVPKG
jgi:outer membrane protein OmpA-like peptidoglycan-associated protein